MSGFIKVFFCFKRGGRFWGTDEKKRGKGLCERGFGITCFKENILSIIKYHRILSILWCLG